MINMVLYNYQAGGVFIIFPVNDHYLLATYMPFHSVPFISFMFLCTFIIHTSLIVKNGSASM